MNDSAQVNKPWHINESVITLIQRRCPKKPPVGRHRMGGGWGGSKAAERSNSVLGARVVVVTGTKNAGIDSSLAIIMCEIVGSTFISGSNAPLIRAVGRQTRTDQTGRNLKKPRAVHWRIRPCL